MKNENSNCIPNTKEDNMFFNDKTRQLINEIEKYLDIIDESALVFFEGTKAFLKNDKDRLIKYLDHSGKLETEADRLRREIKQQLYTDLLIPESRGDVLAILENLDDVTDTAEKVLELFFIETPKIPEEMKVRFSELAEFSLKAVENLILAVRSFFTKLEFVTNYINKVNFYEHEADKLEKELKIALFCHGSIDSLSQKMHLRGFIEKIALLSDLAEALSDRISVYAIKRSM